MPFKSKKQRKWMHANKPKMAKKWEKESVKEGDLGPTTKKGKTVRAVHKKSGKEIVSVDNPSTRKILKKMGFVVKEGIFSSWMVDKAVKIANKMSGNMTGAVKAIEKLKKGLSKDKKVVDALRKANESVKEARTINVEPNWEGMWRFFKQMAKTNPKDWKRMERTLGSDWKKIDAMAKKHKWTESVNEAIEPSGIMAKINKIVQDKQAAKIDGVLMDMFSASIMMRIFNAVNDKSKKDMNKGTMRQVKVILHKVMKQNKVRA